MNSFALVLIVAVYAAIGVKIVKSIFRRPLPDQEEDEEEPEQETDFEYLTVREQLAAANAVSDSVADMEQLRTDLAACSPDDLLGVRITWLGSDGREHQYDLMCNGEDTASECLDSIAARESYELRALLSHQCAVLARGTRSTQNCTQND